MVSSLDFFDLGAIIASQVHRWSVFAPCDDSVSVVRARVFLMATARVEVRRESVQERKRPSFLVALPEASEKAIAGFNE
jgi:hypothetical protein